MISALRPAAILVLLLVASCRTAPKQTPFRDAAVDTPGAVDGFSPSGGRVPVTRCTDRPATTKAAGQACGCHDECGSGYCVDGVCCDGACNETCKACNVPGQVGRCAPLPDGMPPVVAGQCATETVGTCGLDGKCDGRGACRRYPDGTLCEGGRCEEGKVVDAKACNGGSCQPASAVSCAPFNCDPAQSRCFPKCTSDDQCFGVPCVNGSCGKKPLGAVCEAGEDCESGACADGVCCNSACSGPCVSCNQPDKLGRCFPSPAGAADPHGLCPNMPAESCAENGLCNGQGGCARYPVGSICTPASCSGATLNPASVCDESGSCVGGAAISCAPFLCAEGICRGTCQTNEQCLAPASCADGSCGPKGLGQPCKAANECASNFCVDGVCCDSGCEGKCNSCALPNAPGRCTPVPKGVADPRAAAGVMDPALVCIDLGVATCGTNGKCDGHGGCERYADGDVCQGETCDPDTNRSSVGVCQAGTCNVSSRRCNPFACNGNTCGTRCDSNTQCAAPNVCQDNSCGRIPNGSPCSEARPNECESGICAQGVCCGGPCAGSCMSCALPGKEGVCSAVAEGKADPAKTCVDQKPASCGTNGRCDGKGGCQRYAPGTVCSQPTCKAGMAQKASFCDAAGACPAPEVEVCTPIIVCNGAGNACEKTCTKDTQCKPDTKCFGGKCGLLEIGKACDEDSDCMSKSCVDGVCCNSKCVGDPKNPKNDCLACSVKAGAAKDGECAARVVGAGCSDNNACTKTDTCTGTTLTTAVCVGANPVDCSAPATGCKMSVTCDPATGLCPTKPDKVNGSPCDDGKICTVDDKCTGGVCGGAPKCPAMNNPCLTTCDATSGDCNVPKAPGSACSDSNKCTTDDQCNAAGVCVGTFKCTGSICKNPGTCDPAVGTCGPQTDKPAGTNCDDKCSIGRTCMAGKCVGGNPNKCVANGKHGDCVACNAKTGDCSDFNEGGKCVDNNKCTRIERCAAGKCIPMDSTVCPPGACMSCNPDTNQCTIPIPGCTPDAGM
jgi:hypothetical protein